MKYRLTITLILLSSFHANHCMDDSQEASWATLTCLNGIANNSLTQVRFALSIDADVNYIDKKGFPLLYTAWVKKNTTIINILFQQNNINFTLLEETIRNNNLPKIISLSQNNSEPSLATKICIAGIKDNLLAQVKFGLLMGADVNYTDEKGDSFFVHACKKKNEAIAQELLQQKSIDIVTHKPMRDTLLHYASANCLSETVTLILHHMPNIIDSVNKREESALHYAYQKKHSGIIKLLIQNGANVTLQSQTKGTPLLRLYANTNDPRTIDPQIIIQLVSPTDDHGNTQLHLCTTIKTLQTTKFDHYLSFLQAHNLDIFARNNDGKTATDLACEEYKQLYDLYTKKKNIYFQTPLDIQEQVMHAFLRITRLETAKICFYIAASEQIFPAIMPREIRAHIARYYYALNIETIVAKKYHNNQKYYYYFIENKEKIRNELLAKPEPKFLWNA